MTIRLADRGVRAVLLDIEGTTTPIAFVRDVLFPYARARLESHLTARWHDASTQAAVAMLVAGHGEDEAGGHGPPAWPDAEPAPGALAGYAAWLMDRDRKSTGLKLLQGDIWEAGYQAGALRGLVFPDVPGAIRRWTAAGSTVAIYSSGSELAQRRLFESTEHGDLTSLFSGFFDTRVGAKVDGASYARIASALGRAPGELLFVSDVGRELDAAVSAGVQAALCVRPGNPPQDGAERFPRVTTFDELV